MLSLHTASLSFAPTAPMRAPSARVTDVRMESVSDLKTLAKDLNPSACQALA